MGYNLVADTDHLSTPTSREKSCGHFSPEMSRIGQLSAKLEQIEISPKSDQNQWISKGIIRQNLNPKILRFWQLTFGALSPRLLNIFAIGKTPLSLQDKFFRNFWTDLVLLHFCDLVATDSLCLLSSDYDSDPVVLDTLSTEWVILHAISIKCIPETRPMIFLRLPKS